MGRGFAGVEQASKKLEEKRQQQQQTTFLRRFRLKPEEEAIVRFLEQGEDIYWAWVCQLPAQGSRQFGDFTPTRDQDGNGSVPCPMGERGMPRTFRGWINVIHRDAPVLKRDSESRAVRDAQGNYVFDGKADQIEVWEAGIMVMQELKTIDAKFKGLMSRDFSVTRRGSGLATKYSIMPADPDSGSVPMSAADKELESQKFDLNPLITPKSYEELEMLLMGGPAKVVQQSAEEFNPFMPERH